MHARMYASCLGSRWAQPCLIAILSRAIGLQQVEFMDHNKAPEKERQVIKDPDAAENKPDIVVRVIEKLMPAARAQQKSEFRAEAMALATWVATADAAVTAELERLTQTVPQSYPKTRRMLDGCMKNKLPMRTMSPDRAEVLHVAS